jgi:para-aminobenzoate synthetase component 1
VPAVGADLAHVGGLLARDVVEIRHDLAALDEPGFWVVVVTFGGDVTCVRFGDVRRTPLGAVPAAHAQSWQGPAASAWISSLDETSYLSGVAAIRNRIAAGGVYQVNLCRVLRAPAAGDDLTALAGRLAREHPARYAALVAVPSAGLQICSASPELFLRRTARNGDELLETAPIKGTGRSASDLSTKDHAENVMIVDMARNDLGRVARVGEVRVTGLCEVEDYPGLVQLVSRVEATLRPGAGWPEIFAATFPPASVSGAPKVAALSVIAELEPVPRGPYCGAVGYVDNRADDAAGRTTAERAVLAVGIRTFWLDDGDICFGTGAGITWESDPQREWAETQLKAQRLIALASRQ